MRIGVDLDDVLLVFFEPFIEFQNKRYGMNVRLVDFIDYNSWWNIWGIKKERAIQDVRDFYKTDLFKNLVSVDGAQDAIRVLSESHDLFIITARPRCISKKTMIQVRNSFKKSFRGIYFAEHTLLGTGKNKGYFCDLLKLDFMIEDSIELSRSCISPDKREILILGRPWNVFDENSVQGMSRFNSWKDIVRYIG